jgi:hypothetical protein
MKFSNFIDKKKNQARKELRIVGELLERGEMKVDCFINEDDPYIYVRNDSSGLSFDGVRVYKIGKELAYRIQKESKTAPFGAAYGLDLEEIFGELITDMSEEKAAEKIGEALVKEFKNFFKKSSEAQDELNGMQFNGGGTVVIGGRHGDLSNSM